MEKYDKGRSRMQIMTYKDPFKINTNTELWQMMQQYPQLCASDTLAQGLERKYNRCSFQYLRSIEYIFKTLYGRWTNNAMGDMKIYLRLSSAISEIENEKERRVFKNNIVHVLEAIKFLLILGVESDEFPGDLINADQKRLLDLYKKLKSDDTFKHFYPILKLKEEDLSRALKLGVIEEILRELDKQEYLKLYQTDSILIKETQKALDERINYLEQIKHKRGLISTRENSYEVIKKLKHLGNLLNQNLLQHRKIIIHGIHRITPLMYFFFEQLENQMNIEPIFVFNYCEEYPHVYNTWKNVYSWTSKEIIGTQGQVPIEISKIGKKLGDIIEGCDNEETLSEKVVTFANLTNFSNMIATIYEEAYQKVNGDIKKVLAHMKIQYYATNPNKSNNILKMYYPNQFGEKQFLTYPIGQFILSLYSMWDTESKQLNIKEGALDECINAGILLANKYQEVIGIYEKVKVYFSDIVENSKMTIDDYIKRINYLRHHLERVKKDKFLESFSFFSICEEELKSFEHYILELKKISQILFSDTSKTLKYDEHFKKLINVVDEYIKNNDLVSEVERGLISNITDKLEKATVEDIEGLREDLKNAIFLYLSQRKEEASSRWIVRGFEQLDGAVLLSEFSKAQKYHIGLVSETNMSLRVKDELSWPLTERFLEGYQGTKQAINVILTSIKEQRNFMRYSLFYVLAFAKKDIELGYVLEEDDEVNKPYFLLQLLGLSKEVAQESFDVNLPMNNKDRYIQVKDFTKKMNKEQKERFAVCPYKFFLTDIVHSPLIYKDEFQMRYLLSNYIQINLQHGVYNKINIGEIQASIKELFPFWDNIIINDAINKALGQANTKRKAGKQYTRRKKNFLVAGWSDKVTDETYMNFNFNEEYFEEYMDASNIYMKDEYIPYKKICECCNLEEICLMNYYWSKEIQENS